MMRVAETDLNAAVTEIEGLVSQLLQEKDEDNCNQIADRLLDMLQSLNGLDTSLPHVKAVEVQLQNCAVSLWNIAVARTTGGSLHQDVNAKVRHLACNLAFSFSSPRETYASLKEQITMAGRTGRAWLDCQKPTMADQSLSLALDGLEKLRKLLESSPGSSSDEWSDTLQQHCMEVDGDAFKIYVSKAEACVMQEDYERGLEWIQKAKAFLPQIQKESTYLAMLCYNFGCATLEKKKYELTVAWLRESFELGKGDYPIEAEYQARTLRLLASVYLDWDPEQYTQKALNAVGLANAEHSHPSGLHLKIKILLCTKGSDTIIKGAIDDLLSHSDLSVDLAVHTVQMLAQYDKLDIGLNSCQKLAARFSGDANIGKVFLQHLELLLGNKMMSEAKALLEQCIHEQSLIHDTNINTQGLFHSIVWEQAASAYDADDNTDALAWYNYSLKLLLMSNGEHESLAKLQRNRASCFLNLQQLDKAMEAVQEAKKLDATSPFTQYILFKVSLWQADEEGAAQSLQRLSDCSKDPPDKDGPDNKETVLNLISLAAQMALEKSNRAVALRALEKLVQHSEDQQQILTSLRCLTRLQLTSADGKDNTTEARAVLSYLQTAYDTLQSQAECAMDEMEAAWRQEATWFMKIAWNLALETSQNSTLTHESFIFCYKLSQLCPHEKNSMVHQKTCLLMAAAAALQMAREHTERQQKLASFNLCLDHVKACRNINQDIQPGQDGDNKDTASVLLTLYEFEALANLGNVAELDRILGEALSNPSTEMKTLETMAALAMEPPFKATSVCKKALQVIIQKYLQADGVDLNKCSKALHSMVEIGLREGGGNYDVTGRKEAWTYLNTALTLLDNSDQGITEYPEMEILWLLTRSWNTGIQLLSGSHLTDAERWCSLAMKLMTHLTSLKSNYEEKMNNIFAEVRDKIEKSRLKGDQEE